VIDWWIWGCFCVVFVVCVSFGKWGEGWYLWSDLSGCFVMWWVVWWKEGWLFWGV